MYGSWYITQSCFCMHMYVCVNVFVCVCIYIYIYIWVLACSSILVYDLIYTYMFGTLCVCGILGVRSSLEEDFRMSVSLVSFLYHFVDLDRYFFDLDRYFFDLDRCLL